MAQAILGPLFLILLVYPFWGLALLIWMCRRFSVYGTVGLRLVIASLVAPLASLIFTPAVFGAEGFAFVVPWYVNFAFGLKTGTGWPAAAFTFALAFVISFVSGGIPPRRGRKNPYGPRPER